MLATILAQYIDESQSTIDTFLTMSPSDIYGDPYYKELVNKLDYRHLDQSLKEARDTYEEGLPDFMDKFSHLYDFGGSPMSPTTLANWLVSFIKFHDFMHQLPEKHANVPRQALRQGLPDLLSMLDNMSDGREDWQKALALLSIPLVTEG